MVTDEMVQRWIDNMMEAPSEDVVDAIVAEMDSELLAAVHTALEPDCAH
jgi:hypothetical protein